MTRMPIASLNIQVVTEGQGLSYIPKFFQKLCSLLCEMLQPLLEMASISGTCQHQLNSVLPSTVGGRTVFKVVTNTVFCSVRHTAFSTPSMLFTQHHLIYILPFYPQHGVPGSLQTSANSVPIKHLTTI